ncbi:uncharacterized protein VTP21DRAFT_9340 [Calcarisporiella thermophila]|uniref:uncharacterized protein n=1 Tax=Calcarisporiella thermophila TaxID=911321 RepID=UPI00374232B8
MAVCNFYRDRVIPQCGLIGIKTATGNTVKNLGDIIICSLMLLFILEVCWKSRRRVLAVGYKEITLFFTLYMLLLFFQIFATGGFLVDKTESIMWVTSIYIGLVTATSAVLVINAIVALQVFEDGTLVSTFSTFSISVLFFIASSYLAFNIGHELALSNDEFSTNIQRRITVLFGLYVVLPLVCVGIYTVLQIFIVYRKLDIRKPLFRLYFALACFVAAQPVFLIASMSICKTTKQTIDGSPFATFLVSLAVYQMYKYWADITEEEWEGENDPF